MATRALPPHSAVTQTGTTQEELWRNTDWHRLWLTLQQRKWRSLALVPADVGGPQDLTLDAAVALARTGMLQFSIQIHVADATQIGLQDIAEFYQQLRETLATGPVILALAPPVVSPVAVQIAQHADAAVLCVSLGSMRVAESRKAVEDIGRAHFIGAVSFR